MNIQPTLFSRVLPELKAASPYFTTKAIKQRASQLGPGTSLDSLAVQLSEPTAASLIHAPVAAGACHLSQAHHTLLQTVLL